jgi:hypothetical protein
MKKLSLLVLTIGFGVSLIILVGSLLFLHAPPECPAVYTQQQVDDTGCIIGANIGMGPAFGIFISICVAVLTVLVAVALVVLPMLISISKGKRP